MKTPLSVRFARRAAERRVPLDGNLDRRQAGRGGRRRGIAGTLVAEGIVLERTRRSVRWRWQGAPNNGGTLRPPADTGVDGAYTARTANKAYRTTPLHDASACAVAASPVRPRRQRGNARRRLAHDNGIGKVVSPQTSSESSLISEVALIVGIGARERANRRLFREASVPT